MTSWALCVVSSELQAETIAHQIAWAEQTATEKGWKHIRTFGGVSSGKAGPRRHVTELLSELRALRPSERPGWLLMIRADRIGRGRLAESQVLLHEIVDLGVRIWTREGGEYRLDSATDQIIGAVKAGLAALENEVRADKARSVYKRKREAGLAIGNKRPYGIMIGADGKDRAIEAQRAIIKEAFRLRGSGAGYHLISRFLLDTAPPQKFKNGREQVVRWTPQRVARLLANEAYRDTVVSAASFAKAVRAGERLGMNRDSDKRVRHPWRLNGAVRCSCGRALVGLLSGPRERRTRYYGCRALWAHDNKTRLLRADDLEAAFVELLRRLRASPAEAERWRQKAASTVSPRMIERGYQEARTKLAEVARQRERVWSAHAAGKLRDELLEERLDGLREARDEIESTISRFDEQRALLGAASIKDRDANELFARSVDLWQAATVDEQRSIAGAVALTLGGLYVDGGDRLAIGLVEDPGRQRRRSAATR